MFCLFLDLAPSYKTHKKTCKESSIKQSFQINSDIVCGICKFMLVQCGTLCTLIFPTVTVKWFSHGLGSWFLVCYSTEAVSQHFSSCLSQFSPLLLLCSFGTLFCLSASPRIRVQGLLDVINTTTAISAPYHMDYSYSPAPWDGRTGRP